MGVPLVPGLPRGRPGLVVCLASVAALVLTSLDQHQHYRGALGLGLALGVARAATVLLCWSRPVFAASLSIGLGLLTALVSTPVSTSESWPWTISGVLTHVLVLVVLGMRFREQDVTLRQVLAAVWLATQAVGVVAVLARGEQGGFADLIPMAVLSAAAVVIAELLHSRATTRTRLVDETDQRLRAEERARVARELHDVVAHHLSVVVVRADSAAHRLAGLSDEARTEFAAIGDDARESLEQMRRVLRLLRTDSSPAQSTPQPGVDDIAALISGAVDAGARIEVSGGFDDDQLDAAVGLTAYRVVQEALTNAVRHAPGAPVSVDVQRTADRLVVTVTNPLRSTPGAADGHGLRGMRERVAGVDGTLRTGAQADGSFVVRAELPLARRVEASR